MTVNRGREDQVRGALAEVSGLTRAVDFRVPEAQLSCVAAIGAGVWDRLYGAPRPAHLHPFAPIAGAVDHAVSTPGDLRATRLDLCFELCLGDHLARLVDGEILWAPALDRAIVLSTRGGGDYTLYLGVDMSIGYMSHDAVQIQLFLEESLTFAAHTAEAAVVLVAGDAGR